MDLTTRARVKTLLGLESTQHDALLDQLVAQVSAQAADYLGRHAEQVARVEQYTLRPGQTKVFLKGYPVTGTSTFRVSTIRDFANESDLASTDYYLDAARGIVSVDRAWMGYGEGAFRATYTGGLATTAAGVATAFPGIAGAVDVQVAFLFKRRDSLGLAGFSANGGNVSFETPVEFIPMVKTALRKYRRMAEDVL